MILDVLKWPDKRLSQVTLPINPLSDDYRPEELQTLIQDMIDTMHARRGIGLAAPQVGASVRLFVMARLALDEGRSPAPSVHINPTVLRACPKETAWEELCLSVDGPRTVRRPKWIEARWLDEHWHEHTERLSHLGARCFLHELDHLNGVTIASADSAWQCGICGMLFTGDYCPTCGPEAQAPFDRHR